MSGLIAIVGRPNVGKSALFNCVAVLFVVGWLSADAMGNTSVVCWGQNNVGQTNTPTTLTNAVALAAGGNYNLALLENLRVTAWGGQTNVPTGLSNVVAIAAGGSGNLALKQDGTLVAWETTTTGITNVPAAATNIIAIAAGGSHCLALRHDGTVLAWGATNHNQTTIPPEATNIVAISAGGAHNAVLRADGAVICWGLNNYGQAPIVPQYLTNVIAVSSGGAHTLALRADGSHSYWGVVAGPPFPGRSNAPTGISNVVAFASGSLHTVSLLTDTTVLTSSSYPPLVTNMPSGLSNVVAAAAGQGAVNFSAGNMFFSGGTHALVLVSDGSIHTPPGSRSHSLRPGSFLILNPMATGPRPLTYQWRLNGANIDGATQPNFIVSKSNRRSAGDYSVIISNGFETITSLVAHVSVPMQQRLEAVGVMSSGQFVFHSGDADGTPLVAGDLPGFILEASLDCRSWEPLALSPTLTNGVMRFVDQVGGANPSRFYRVREQ